jgi:hypothetical protein
LKRKRILPDFGAGEKKPYGSSTLGSVQTVVHKVIHRKCAELFKFWHRSPEHDACQVNLLFFVRFLEPDCRFLPPLAVSGSIATILRTEKKFFEINGID